MISVMIIEEMDLVRGALAALLTQEEDLDVAQSLPLRQDALVAAGTYRPDVVMIDLDRYGEAGLAAARRLGEELPECRVLLLTSRHTAAVVRRALTAGVWGIASPDASPAQLAQVIRQVAAGERAIDQAAAAAAFRAPDSPLTSRERAVLQLAGDGLRAPEIARALFLSPGTVRNYLSSAVRKTGARSRLEAAHRAREEGWL